MTFKPIYTITAEFTHNSRLNVKNMHEMLFDSILQQLLDEFKGENLYRTTNINNLEEVLNKGHEYVNENKKSTYASEHLQKALEYGAREKTNNVLTEGVLTTIYNKHELKKEDIYEYSFKTNPKNAIKGLILFLPKNYDHNKTQEIQKKIDKTMYEQKTFDLYDEKNRKYTKILKKKYQE
jgi:hypothetical protein